MRLLLTLFESKPHIIIIFHLKTNRQKLEKHHVNGSQTRSVFTTLYINFADAQGQITPQSVLVSGRISNSSSMYTNLVTCKNEDDSIKNEGARVVTAFFPL